jgi:hypothetical protein
MNTPVMFVIDDDLREILTSEEVFLGTTNKGRIQISEIQYLDESEYNNILMHDNILKHVLLFDDYLEQVNWETTMQANSAASYLLSNQIAGIPELTIDDLKNFRTWLATILLENQDLFRSYNRDFEKTIQMLTYYSENMYDSVCKALINFANIPVIKADLSVASCYSGCNTQVMINPQTTIQSGCSCNGNSVTAVGNITAGCLDMYRRNVYNWMVIVFSDSNFWANFIYTDPNLIDLIIRYMEGILESGLPLTKQCDKITYNDCSCLNNDTEEANKQILRNAIRAFGYIRDNNISFNYSFIYNSLNKWASVLYEIMQW